VKGRLLSSSYTPEPNHPNYRPMLDALQANFDRYQADGKVTFDYLTLLYFGHLA
jgi:hypothetical protein